MKIAPKVAFFLAATILASLAFCGCGDLILSGDPGGEDSGSIIVRLPTAASRDAASMQALTKAYGIVVFNPAVNFGFYTATALAGDPSVTLNQIKAGSYSIMVMAFGQGGGVATGTDPWGNPTRESPAYVVGSGETKGVTVVAGETATPTVTLYPADIGGFVSSFDMIYNVEPPYTQVSWTGIIDLGNLNDSIKITKLYFTTLDQSVPLLETSIGVDLPCTGAEVSVALPTTYYTTDYTDGSLAGNLALDLAGLQIREGAFVKSISAIWPSLPTDEVGGTMINGLGCLIGYSGDPASQATYLYDMDGTVNNWNGMIGGIAATVQWVVE